MLGHEGVRVFVDSGNPGRPNGSDGRGSGPRSTALAAVGFIGLPLLVGAAESGLTMDAVRGWYHRIEHPPGVPPDAVFAAVWTVLYVMIGVAAWLTWREADLGRASAGASARALRWWGWQLLANAAWVPAFFGLHSPAAGLAVIIPLLALICVTINLFRQVKTEAAALMLPYLAWTCYATYLDAGVLIVNHRW